MVPDFLQQYFPEDGQINFEDDSGDEDDGGNEGGFGGGFEAADGDAAVGDAWGAAQAEGGDTGFTAEAAAPAAEGADW